MRVRRKRSTSGQGRGVRSKEETAHLILPLPSVLWWVPKPSSPVNEYVAKDVMGLATGQGTNALMRRLGGKTV
jgi:hypothetical protein